MPNFENPLDGVKVKVDIGPGDLGPKTEHWLLNGNLDNYKKPTQHRKGVEYMRHD